MNNMISYAEREFETFEERPFCAVDSLILSWVVYMHPDAVTSKVCTWDGVRLADIFCAEAFPELFSDVWDPKKSRRLLTALAASPRFRNIRLMGYTEQCDCEKEKQFAAMTFRLLPNLNYIAFRGTDLSVVGWKEDFNMAFRYPVPAQEEAKRYAECAVWNCAGTLLLGGHSKGGNLAVYSAANSAKAIQQRIERIYSHDGPGFLEHVLKSESFRAIVDRIDKTIPQSSIVGMLLEHQEAYRVVKSKHLGVWQHDPFSWVVQGQDFRYIDHLRPEALYLDHTVTKWLEQIPAQDRERFVDALFGILNTTDIETFSQLRTDWQKNVPVVVQAASQMDADTRQFLFRTLKDLAVLSVKNVPELLKNEKE